MCIVCKRTVFMAISLHTYLICGKSHAPKERTLLQNLYVLLENLVPENSFYRKVEAKPDLSFVRNLVKERYAPRMGRSSTEVYKKMMRKRLVWVEPLFGEIKQWHQGRRFRLRRLRKVNTESSRAKYQALIGEEIRNYTPDPATPKILNVRRSVFHPIYAYQRSLWANYSIYWQNIGDFCNGLISCATIGTVNSNDSKMYCKFLQGNQKGTHVCIPWSFDVWTALN